MATNDSSLNQIRAMTALVIIGTFLFGAAVGAGLLYWLTPGPLPPPPPPVFHMLGELGLSTQQQQQAQDIRDRHEPKLRAIFLENFPKLRAAHNQMEEELRTILTPEQRQKLDELKTRRPFRGGFGPPPPGMGPPGAGLPPPFPPPPDSPAPLTPPLPSPPAESHN